ncbi:MAG TPA: acylphosphatase [Nanoarchaeota archaeon]|nr:acylphosphatase [Candidatus Woesearchaeota archaeon]HIH15380.1 acylphosphatase [Nanoarchaeota archaeon]HIH58821.1 acylphosphatase [Nanoarchaeota archaeon]HII14262.1 acylphosphatase [Nanoarchaeota archaeon]HIJ05501.1 acylphosphatase [Nanoarchaeota archaeon]
MKMKRRVHIKIKGRVQGVFFRVALKEKAKALHIQGWVKNAGDDVEAVFEGENENIKHLLEFCIIGPKGAKVTGIDIDEEAFLDGFTDFTQE